MALLGEDYQIYLKDGYIPKAINTFFTNNWWLSQPYFEVVQPGSTPGGDTINEIIEYSSTSNAEAYVRGAPAPDPDKTNIVRAYWTKDYYQGGAKVYGIDQANAANNGTEIPVRMIEKAIDNSLINLGNAFNAVAFTDLAAQVDATTAFSDAALARATYTLASLETGVAGAQTLAVLEDSLEALRNTTYGMANFDDLVILMPPNQLTNHSRLTSFDGAGAAWLPQLGGGAVDGGRVQHTRTFEGIPIAVVPGMTNTEIYILPKSTTKIYLNKAVETGPKDVAAWEDYWLSTMGANLVVQDPRRCVKLTGVTA